MKDVQTFLGRMLSLALVFTLCVGTLAAQQTTSSIRGQITDPTGAVIVAAKVSLVDASGVEKTALTDEQGNYTFNVAPGKYTLRASAEGFAGYDDSQVVVAAGDRVRHDIKLAVSIRQQEVKVDAGSTHPTVDPDRNGAAIVLKGNDLDALPDDPEELAMVLQALAGPSAGPNGAQVYVDGFTSLGRLPSKAAIREIQINRNPFSADNDKLGYGRIDLLTRPGTDQFHGRLDFQFNDAILNSRNPFGANKPSFQSRIYGGVLTGPLVAKRISYTLALHRREIDDNAIINATILDPSFNISPFSLAVLTPRRELHISPRLDFQLNSNNTLITQYLYTRNTVDNAGIGDFSLASRAYGTVNSQNGFRVLETAILSSKVITDTRFQYIRLGRDANGDNSQPAISVLDAFIGGGAQIGRASFAQAGWEAHNYTSFALGQHTLKVGGRVRGYQISDLSPTNFGGTFTFAGGLAPQLDSQNHIVVGDNGPVLIPVTSIERYRRTELFRSMGLSAAEIRALGGGATQFSIAGGNPKVDINQVDVGLFAQDDWRLRHNLTLSFGLRYETQSNIDHTIDLAPRVAVAWAPGAASGKQPSTVIRAGFGVFYDRFGENLVLETRRLNGINQQSFVVTDPTVLDLYPNVSSLDNLLDFALPQTIRTIGADLRSPYTLQSSISVERRLPWNTAVTISYLNARAVHVLRSRNINAPLPGTNQRPFADAGNIYAYESSGTFKQHQIIVNFTNRLNRRVSLFANYAFNWAHSDTDGPGTFPSNTYDLDGDFGRSSLDVRHRFFFGGVLSTVWGISVNPLIIMRSGAPFNIITGRDTNGDALFTERPAIASGANQSDVVATKYGLFDLTPEPGAKIIPRNFAQGPALYSVNVRLTKTIGFGGGGSHVVASAGPPPARPSANDNRNGNGNGATPPPARPSLRIEERPYKLTFGVQMQNLFNHTNAGTPIGNLSSIFFGQSNSTAGAELGVGSATSNRRITFQMSFTF